MADNDLNCVPAEPAAPPTESSVKTEKIDLGGADGEKPKYWKAIIGFLAFAIVAGAAFYLVKARYAGGAASASAETAAVGEDDAEVTEGSAAANVAVKASAGDSPAECEGEIADAQLSWYCKEFLSFARKAAADHVRLDRLEAAGRTPSDPGVPRTLWVIIIAIGVLTVFNTVQILAKKKTPPPAG